jgi:hypothetical protein
MQKPEPLKPEQLEHKNVVARKSKWNGDKIRSDRGFDGRRQAEGLTVVEGTRPPNPARVKPSRHFMSRPVERGPDHPKQVDLNQVTEQQKRMLSDRSRKGKSCS